MRTVYGGPAYIIGEAIRDGDVPRVERFITAIDSYAGATPEVKEVTASLKRILETLKALSNGAPRQ